MPSCCFLPNRDSDIFIQPPATARRAPKSVRSAINHKPAAMASCSHLLSRNLVFPHLCPPSSLGFRPCRSALGSDPALCSTSGRAEDMSSLFKWVLQWDGCSCGSDRGRDGEEVTAQHLPYHLGEVGHAPSQPTQRIQAWPTHGSIFQMPGCV